MGTLGAGVRLGPYAIVRQIGAGGMGEVYLATDVRLGRSVAVKVLPERLVSNATAMQRFHLEARAVAALSHPNIVAVHDFGQHEAVVYVVLEYLEGETLRTLLDRGGDGWRASVEFVAIAADAIAEVHAHGVVHRDLKPDNLFITSRGVLKILDFGVATTFSSSDDQVTRSVGTADQLAVRNGGLHVARAGSRPAGDCGGGLVLTGLHPVRGTDRHARVPA